MFDFSLEQTAPNVRLQGMRKYDLIAEVQERRDAAGVWSVEAIEYNRDGSVYVTLFDGPDARERAVEYAHAKYADVKVAQ